MNKYYIPEINLKQIKNNNILTKLENKYHMTTKKLEIIITNDGFYKLENDKLENDKFIKYKIINKNSFIKENFIKNMTLIGMNYYHKKIGEVFHIPYEHAKITIEQITFSVGKETLRRRPLLLNIFANFQIGISSICSSGACKKFCRF